MKRLSPKEEEVLRCFWQQGPMFVRQLLAIAPEPKPHYNTLSTIVRSLEEKGYVGWNDYGGSHQYYALVTEDQYRKWTLQSLVGKYFDNSYRQVVSAFVEEEQLTVADLQELINQIKSKS